MSKVCLFSTKLISAVTLTIFLSSQIAWGGYEDKVLSALKHNSCMRGQEAGEAKPEVVSGIAKAIGRQSIVTPDIDEIPSVDLLGEKPYKLLKMAKAGLNVPAFFVVLTDGSGKLIINDELRFHFDRLKKLVIARSAHRMEGSPYPFSGVFISYENIDALVSETDFSMLSDNEIDDYLLDNNWNVGSLQNAYHLIVDGAAKDPKVKEYLEEHNITDFDPNLMNLIVMEQKKVDVFGMFLTSDQNNPDITLIHYRIEGKAGNEEDSDDSSKLGGVITYNKKTGQLENSQQLDDNAKQVLIQFGKTAEKIENMFGLQQIELCSSGGVVYVLQSRSINLADPSDIPRFSPYRTISTELFGIGYGYYRNLPVLVIDSLEKVHPDYRQTSEYEDLNTKYMSTKDEEEKRKYYKEIDDLINKERQKYRQELLSFQRENPEYILVVKDASDVVHSDFWQSNNIRYEFLNSLARQAKVVIRGRNQIAIRHEDWDNVEKGGFTVILPESGGVSERFIATPRQYQKNVLEFEDDTTRIKRAQRNVEVAVQRHKAIHTGDRLSALSNIDGFFVWHEAMEPSRADAMGRFPLEHVDPVEIITTSSGKTLSEITRNLEDKDDSRDREVMAALYELSDPREWYFLTIEQRDYAFKLSMMNRDKFAEELEKYRCEQDTFADLDSYEKSTYHIGHNLSWLVRIQNLIWTLVNTAAFDEQEKAHFENVRGNVNDGTYQPYDLRRYSEIVGRLSQVAPQDEKYKMFYDMFYKELMGIQFQRELYYRWWDTAPKPRSHLLMLEDARVGTDKDLIEAVKKKLNVSVLAAAVVEPNKDNRERLATDLKTYWGFDEVLAVESVAELNQMLQEEKYQNLKLTLVVNNTEESFYLPIIKITSQTTDIRKPIRDYLKSI